MMHIALLAAIALLQATPPQDPPPSRTSRQSDSLAVFRGIVEAERLFFQRWERAWTASESERFPTYYHLNGPLPPGAAFHLTPRHVYFFDPRAIDQACYFGWKAPPNPPPLLSDYSWGLPVEQRRIRSTRNPEHWVCPNWLPPRDYYFTGPIQDDERLVTDAPLDPARRNASRRARTEVIRQITTAMRRFPRSNFLTGQRIRLLVDNGELDSASHAIAGCRADAWWCATLAGYVHARAGRIGDADVAFARADSVLPARERCLSNDLRVLFDENEQGPYSRLTCAGRDSVNARVWWLADPLWSVAGNDRKVEQDVRLATIRLRAATQRDARYDWSPQGGGDALAEMVMRYGWPTFTYMSPIKQRTAVLFPPPNAPKYGHSLLFRPAPKGKPLVDPNAIYWPPGLRTTFEYSLGRAHVIPRWYLVQDPFSARSSDWSLSAPAGDWEHRFAWWPAEHYAPPYPIVPISDQQTAFLRRDDHAMFAYATNLARTDVAQLVSDSLDVRFVVSTGPSSVITAAAQRRRATDRVVFYEPVTAQPTMIGVEIPSHTTDRPAARARFGVRPPAPLRDLNPGAVAISDPVLLVVPPDGSVLPVFADSAIALMAGTTTLLPTTRSLGVYWETYGFTPADSVEVTVGVRGANASTTSWREPSPDRTTRTIGGTVPIQMRSVILDIETLPPGTYQLEVAVQRPGSDGVRSYRQFVVR